MEEQKMIVSPAIQSIIEFLMFLNAYVKIDIIIMELLYVHHAIILGNI